MSQNSSSCSKKSLESLNSILKIPKPFYFKNVTSSLHLARGKLLPIINRILKSGSENSLITSNQSPSSYRITLDQYNDVIGAVQLLKEVDAALRKSSSKTHFKKLFKYPNFNFDSKIKLHESGKIYIDGPILTQLINLHNLLGDIIDFMQEYPQDKQFFDSNEERKLNLENISSDSLNETQQVRVEKITREILTCLTLPMTTDFTVLTSSEANSKNNQLAKLEEKKNEASKHASKESHLNADGAKKIIIRCMADLDKVRHFLEKDFSVDGENNKLQPNVSTHSVSSILTDNPQGTCSCLENCPMEQPLEFTWKENGEAGSKLIICIKGKSEDEGDIHVVIRQCPECQHSKNAECYIDSNEETVEEIEPVHDTDQPVRETPRSSTEKHFLKDSSHKHSAEHSKHSSKDTSKSETSDSVKVREVEEHTHHETILKSKDDNKTDHKNINVIFNPENPSHSVVEGPNIHLNDTINLNFISPECNQDLVISLSVKPKDTKSKHVLNIDDIFNDSQASIGKSTERMDKHDNVISFFRTKICSSMEIDVDVGRSKLQTMGLQHQNVEVQSKLNDIGVNNILRASRPAKCGRMAVLDEYSSKNLPYSVSLRSLPLSDRDIQCVNQSLNMSVNKMKQTKINVGAKEWNLQ